MPEVGVEPTRPEGHGILSWASDLAGSRPIWRFGSVLGFQPEGGFSDLDRSRWVVLPSCCPPPHDVEHSGDVCVRWIS